MRFRILQLSDPHSTDSHRPLRAIIDLLDETTASFDAIVVSGDLVQRGQLDAYRHVAEDLAELAHRAEVITVLGNHDDLQAAAGLPGLAPAGRVGVHDLAAVRLVSFDSNPGRVDQSLLAELDQALDQPGQLGTIVVMHHPPFACSLPALIVENFDQPEAFARLVAGRVRLIVTGHYHQTTSGSVAGVPVWSAPALSYQRLVSLDPTRPGGWGERPLADCQFSLIELDETDFQATIVGLDAAIAAATEPLVANTIGRKS